VAIGVCAAQFVFVRASQAGGDQVEEIRPDRAGLRVTESVRVALGTYELIDRHEEGAIRVEGNDLTVDFQGATLVGSPPGVEADAFAGRGIVIRGRNVTVRNAQVRGYKLGIFAEDAPGLTLDGCDVSFNYRQRLKSTIEREDLSDWLYGHENDENEWLRYGAGIYLFRCSEATVVSCRARNGQNGLCISRCDQARIVDNDMSFMSGWGLAMWRSSRCEVFNNKFDWCIRGYSHGIYSRGQDSTGILVYEQCNNNLFAYNSATHGGDGFFLYAGNETLRRTGQGGCNGNVVYGNDFSHAAANGIEATFSKDNVFTGNILRECTHGVWAGYSYDTIVENNLISGCKYGVSIEHGRNNRIAGNTISESELGVHLWWDDDEDLLASAFAKAHDRCPSTDNVIVANRFQRVMTAIRLADDSKSTVTDNAMGQVDVPVHLLGDVSGLKLSLTQTELEAVEHEGRGKIHFDPQGVAPRPWSPRNVVTQFPRLVTGRGSQDAFLSQDALRGRRFIYVDEWGPYDFSDFRVFPSKVLGGPASLVQLLGLGSPYQVTTVTGDVTVVPERGTLPQRLTVTADSPGVHVFSVEIDTDGRTHRAAGTLLNAQWHVSFYAWSEENDPRDGPEAWRRILASEALDSVTAADIDFAWYHRAPSEKIPPDRFATVATTSVKIPAGRWRVRAISDDGIRVLIDNRGILENWTWHAATTNEAVIGLEGGEHAIRIEHFEIDGLAQLQLRLDPASD